MEQQEEPGRAVAETLSTGLEVKTMVEETIPSRILELPEELFGLVVAKLPLQNLFQLRTVCTQWNATLHDASFIEKYLQLARRAPLFVWRTEKGFAAYSPDASSWHICSSSCYLMEGSWYKVSGAVDGCVLVENRDGFDRSFHLLNPMTRSQRKLSSWPEFQEEVSSLLGVVHDDSSSSYKVFAVNRGISTDEYLYEYQGVVDDEEDDGRAYKLYVYDSKSDRWKICGTWENYDVMRFDLPTLHRGVMHCLVTGDDFIQKLFIVFRSDGDGAWLQLKAPMPPQLQSAHLFNWQGKLMLVGGKGSRGRVSSVHVWQLDQEKSIWMENTTMPDELLPCFFPEPQVKFGFQCDSSGDYVCVTIFSRDARFGHRHVMCNVAKASWWELPELLSMPGKSTLESHTEWNLGSFQFKPSFDNFP